MYFELDQTQILHTELKIHLLELEFPANDRDRCLKTWGLPFRGVFYESNKMSLNEAANVSGKTTDHTKLCGREREASLAPWQCYFFKV